MRRCVACDSPCHDCDSECGHEASRQPHGVTAFFECWFVGTERWNITLCDPPVPERTP